MTQTYLKISVKLIICLYLVCWMIITTPFFGHAWLYFVFYCNTIAHQASCICLLCAQFVDRRLQAACVNAVSKDLHSEGGSVCRAQVIDRFAIPPCILIAFSVGVQGHWTQKLSVPLQYPGNFAAVREWDCE